MRISHVSKLLPSALTLIALAALWFTFAPSSLGGSTNYVITDGISMEPHFHSGDLVLVRSKSDYHVGEVVAYDSHMFHTVVLHRIIAIEGDRYVFKGDNNNFTDFEHPRRSQLIGSLWIHLPGWGSKLSEVHSPALIGLLVAISALMLMGVGVTRRRRLSRRERRAGEPARAHHMTAHLASSDQIAAVLAVGLLALMPIAALAIVAFTRSSHSRVSSQIPYKQSAEISYTANSTPGPTYAGNRAVTGEPIFTHVVSSVHFRLAYQFHAAAAHEISGRASLDAQVTSSSGWRTEFELGTPSYFRGDHAAVSANLDLTSLLALLHRVEQTTAVNATYTLTLVPHVRTSGTVEGAPVSADFSPLVPFSLSELEMQPLTAGGAALAAATRNQFSPASSGAVTGVVARPIYITLGPVRVAVATARTVALIAMLAIMLAMAAAIALLRRRPRDEASRIESRYGRMIVPVAHVRQLTGVGIIDVADMDALARIAEHYDRSILHETGHGGESYWVSDESGQFRYAVGAAEEAGGAASAAASPRADGAGAGDPITAVSQLATPAPADVPPTAEPFTLEPFVAEQLVATALPDPLPEAQEPDVHAAPAQDPQSSDAAAAPPAAPVAGDQDAQLLAAQEPGPPQPPAEQEEPVHRPAAQQPGSAELDRYDEEIPELIAPDAAAVLASIEIPRPQPSDGLAEDLLAQESSDWQAVWSSSGSGLTGEFTSARSPR